MSNCRQKPNCCRGIWPQYKLQYQQFHKQKDQKWLTSDSPAWRGSFGAAERSHLAGTPLLFCGFSERTAWTTRPRLSSGQRNQSATTLRTSMETQPPFSSRATRVRRTSFKTGDSPSATDTTFHLDDEVNDHETSDDKVNQNG